MADMNATPQTQSDVYAEVAYQHKTVDMYFDSDA